MVDSAPLNDAIARPCPACGSSHRQVIADFREPCRGEKTCGVPLEEFHRRLARCGTCGLFENIHGQSATLEALYRGSYNDDAYGGDPSALFDRVRSLPAGQSDNVGRVARLADWVGDLGGRWPCRILDVGCGSGVFVAAMAERGCRATVVDPDPRSVAHSRARAGAEAGIVGGFLDLSGTDFGDGAFDGVCFNKVLEHVLWDDAVAMLRKAADLLGGDGKPAWLWGELPDGEAAAADSPERQEFFIEHFHAFSPASIDLLTRSAGLRLERLQRLREPSGKYTLRFLATRQIDHAARDPDPERVTADPFEGPIVALPHTFIVFDLEYTSWPGAMERGWEAIGKFPEIVHIGAVLVGPDRAVDTAPVFDQLVKPRLEPVLSDYFKQLTAISQESVDRHGIDLATAARRFAEFSRGLALFSNGDDLLFLRRNCEKFGIELGIQNQYWRSVREGFMGVLGAQRPEVSSGRVLERLGDADGQQRLRAHNGVDDARAVAMALIKLEGKRSRPADQGSSPE